MIPLVIKKEKMELVKKTAGEKPLCRLLPYSLKKAGIITTGNEVFYGIQDTFTPVVKNKLEQYGIQAEDHITVGDEKEKITAGIRKLKARGCELIIATGGMSVDPDDQTPGAIKESGAEVVTYGAPVLPSYVLPGLFLRRHTGYGAARLCHVCKNHDLRSGPAQDRGRSPDLQEGYYQAWKWRIVSGLRGMPLAGLRLWDLLNADRERDELTVLE